MADGESPVVSTFAMAGAVEVAQFGDADGHGAEVAEGLPDGFRAFLVGMGIVRCEFQGQLDGFQQLGDFVALAVGDAQAFQDGLEGRFEELLGAADGLRRVVGKRSLDALDMFSKVLASQRCEHCGAERGRASFGNKAVPFQNVAVALQVAEHLGDVRKFSVFDLENDVFVGPQHASHVFRVGPFHRFIEQFDGTSALSAWQEFRRDEGMFEAVRGEKVVDLAERPADQPLAEVIARGPADQVSLHRVPSATSESDTYRGGSVARVGGYERGLASLESLLFI